MGAGRMQLREVSRSALYPVQRMVKYEDIVTFSIHPSVSTVAVLRTK